MKLIHTLILSIAAATSLAAEPAPRPNILYFFVDDMGWGSIGPNGQAERKAKGLPHVRTPNIDQLAARGVNFSRGYACHVCSPARSSQQTGFHQGHTFADRNDPDNAKKAMRADDILMGDALSSAGYTTGYWGKWGYGGSKDMNHPTIDNVQTLPTSHGYQFVLAELHHVRAHTFFQPSLWSAPARTGTKGGLELIPNSMAKYANNPAYPDSPSNHNHADYPKTGYCDDAYAFAALDFVRENAKSYNRDGKPFFGLFAAQIPHGPFEDVSKLPQWSAAYRDDEHFAKLPAQAKQWAAMVTRIDAHIGNILAALEDPNGDGDPSDSVADNTLVIFQSDNGGPGGPNNSAFDSNGGLRGNKGSIYEGGIRVPLVVRWPAKISDNSKLKPGSNIDRVVDVTDLLPTFCELAGVATPLGLDGVSIAPTLTGRGHQRIREFVIHEAGNGQSIIRGNHKLVRNAAAGKRKKRQATAPGFALFDLEADRAEKNNIAAAKPELVKELKALLLGERVAEPRGFANTYHHWTGKDGAVTSDPANWSDYNYENAGISYLTDDGAPRLSWTAKFENTGEASSVANADADLEFLGLEISGTSSSASQALALGADVNLTGRNEIRVSNNGKVSVNGGTVSSLRWITVAAGARFGGYGKVDGNLQNSGVVAVSNKGSLEISADYHETADAVLVIAIDGKSPSLLRVIGQAKLASSLALSSTRGFSVEPGTTITILKAGSISGTFKNSNRHIVDDAGNTFEIGYTDKSVTLTANN